MGKMKLIHPEKGITLIKHPEKSNNYYFGKIIIICTSPRIHAKTEAKAVALRRLYSLSCAKPEIAEKSPNIGEFCWASLDF